MMLYFLRRLLQSFIVIVGVFTVVFFLIHLIPGDPVELLLGEMASPEDHAVLRHNLGLEMPVWQQYFILIEKVFLQKGGVSLSFGRPVFDLLWERMFPTIALAMSGLGLALILGALMGLLMALQANKKIDHFLLLWVSFMHSVPLFVKAPLLVAIFSIGLKVLPVSGFGAFGHFVLPSFCLALGLSGWIARQLRSSLLDVLVEDYIRTARAKGLSETRVLCFHALRNALLPMMTVVAQLLGGLLSGAILTETLFDWPGLGRLLYFAFHSRDYPLIQGIILWISVVYVSIGMLVDWIYRCIDPRISFAKKTGLS